MYICFRIIVLWPRLIKKYGGQLTDSLDLSSLSKISDGYTPGQIVNVIQNVMSERRIKQVCLELCQYSLDKRRLLNVFCTFNLRPVSRGYSANIYLFKVNKINARKRCEICSKLTIKTPKTIKTPTSLTMSWWSPYSISSNKMLAV